MGKANRRTIGHKPRVILPALPIRDDAQGMNGLFFRVQNTLWTTGRGDMVPELRRRWRELRRAPSRERYALLTEYVDLWPTPSWATQGA